MKAFISVSKPELEAVLDDRFGRAPYFLVVDTEKGNIWKAIENPNTHDEHGVGIKTANMAINEDVDCVIGKHFGPKVADVLRSAGIKMYSAEIMKVSEVIKKCNNSELTEIK